MNNKRDVDPAPLDRIVRPDPITVVFAFTVFGVCLGLVVLLDFPSWIRREGSGRNYT